MELSNGWKASGEICDNLVLYNKWGVNWKLKKTMLHLPSCKTHHERRSLHECEFQVAKSEIGCLFKLQNDCSHSHYILSVIPKRNISKEYSKLNLEQPTLYQVKTFNSIFVFKVLDKSRDFVNSHKTFYILKRIKIWFPILFKDFFETRTMYLKLTIQMFVVYYPLYWNSWLTDSVILNNWLTKFEW